MINYNPMSKEFQDECKKLGLTGRQLTAKYQKEEKFLEKCVYKRNNINRRYTRKELLDFMRQFYEENGRPPMKDDFTNNPEYPSAGTYQIVFGSWNNAIIEAGLYINEGGIQYSEEELLDYLRQFYIIRLTIWTYPITRTIFVFSC